MKRFEYLTCRSPAPALNVTALWKTFMKSTLLTACREFLEITRSSSDPCRRSYTCMCMYTHTHTHVGTHNTTTVFYQLYGWFCCTCCCCRCPIIVDSWCYCYCTCYCKQTFECIPQSNEQWPNYEISYILCCLKLSKSYYSMHYISGEQIHPCLLHNFYEGGPLCVFSLD